MKIIELENKRSSVVEKMQLRTPFLWLTNFFQICLYNAFTEVARVVSIHRWQKRCTVENPKATNLSPQHPAKEAKDQDINLTMHEVIFFVNMALKKKIFRKQLNNLVLLRCLKCDVWTHIFGFVQHCILFTLIGLAMKVELEFVAGRGMYSESIHVCVSVRVCVCEMNV